MTASFGTAPKLPVRQAPVTRHSRERSELHRHFLDYVVHELGNAASPLLMAAELLNRSQSDDARTTAARSLRGVSGALAELSSSLRFIRNDQRSEYLSTHGFTNTGAWWQRLEPLFRTCIPQSAVLTGEDAHLQLHPSVLGAMTWCTLGALKMLGELHPHERTFHLACRAHPTLKGVELSITVQLTQPQSTDSSEARRWRRFLTQEAADAGGTMSIRRFSGERMYVVFVPG